MSAVIMNTRNIAATLRQHLRQDVAAFTRQYRQMPSMVLIGIPDDQSTLDMVRIVSRNAPELGVRFSSQLFPITTTAGDLRRAIEILNNDPTVHGISLQLPLPKHLNVDEIASYIALEKDVEGLHPAHMGHTNMGKSLLAAPPALSAMKLLSLYNINPAGRHVVIVGRNMMIGRPLASLMTQADATVTVCHSQTNSLHAHTRQAEILITAAGQAGLIKAEMVRPGAVVIDFGINYIGRGQITGDVDFEQVVKVAGAVTPMPGGTGPLTVICLVENLLKAARSQAVTELNAGVSPSLVEPDQPFTFRTTMPEADMRPTLPTSRPELLISPPSVAQRPPNNGYFPR